MSTEVVTGYAEYGGGIDPVRAAQRRFSDAMLDISLRTAVDETRDDFYVLTAGLLLENEAVLAEGVQHPEYRETMLRHLDRLMVPPRVRGEYNQAERYARQAGAFLFNRLAPQISESLEASPSEAAHKVALSIARSALTQHDTRDQSATVDFVIDRLPADIAYRARRDNEAPFMGYAYSLDSLLDHADKRQQTRLMQTAAAAVASPLLPDANPAAETAAHMRLGAELATVGIQTNLRGEAEFYREHMLLSIMQRFGIRPETLETSWALASSAKNLDVYRRENIAVMCQLEAKRPGICRTLFERCNIRNFAFHSEEVWVSQYDNLDRTDVDYGELFVPRYDHTGASKYDQDIFHNLRQRLEVQNCLLRVYEVDSAQGLGARIIDNAARYGQAKFGLLLAHSNWDIVQLNRLRDPNQLGPSAGSYMSERHLARPGVDALEQAWDRTAPWVFLGCTWRLHKWRRPGVSLQRRVSERFPGVPVVGGPDDGILSLHSLDVHRQPDDTFAVDAQFMERPQWNMLPVLKHIRASHRRVAAQRYHAGKTVVPAVDLGPPPAKDLL